MVAGINSNRMTIDPNRFGIQGADADVVDFDHHILRAQRAIGHRFDRQVRIQAKFDESLLNFGGHPFDKMPADGDALTAVAFCERFDTRVGCLRAKGMGSDRVAGSLYLSSQPASLKFRDNRVHLGWYLARNTRG